MAEEEHDQSVQLTNNQDNEESEMNFKDMKERAEMGCNDVAAKYVHDKISETICSNRIVCGGRYRKRCQLYCANSFCPRNRLRIFWSSNVLAS
jgi:hypothetical protein